MAFNPLPVFYMCLKCLEPADDQTACPRCGGERVKCRPGEPDDPCRRPLMSPTGQLKGRAPIWWLRWSVGEIGADASNVARTTEVRSGLKQS
jgi:hypothetical protein